MLCLNDVEIVLGDIRLERLRQYEKWAIGEQGLSRERLLAVLTEEFLEVVRAVNDHEPWEHLREELIQVAAVCVKFVSVRQRSGE